jgi:hypothetical protein
MATIAPRVDELEKTVSTHAVKIQEHDQILNGVKDCPGVVGDVVDIKDTIVKINLLLNSQTLYNKIITFFASALALSIVAYLVKLVLK